MMELPWQLKRLDFRFIRIAMDGINARKRPIDCDWVHGNNLNFMRNELKEWVDQGNNYGVCCGYGKLAVIDCDEIEVEEIVENKFPRTFTVRTGSGGKHYYFIIPDFVKKIKMQTPEKHYGEIQWEGQQVIGPGSLHPSGNRYEVVCDESIAEISHTTVWQYLSNYIQKNTTQRKLVNNLIPDYKFIDISQFLNMDNYQSSGDEWFGSHPAHGSTTGANFRFNIKKGQWHCFRCDCGGGVVTLIAILEKLINCGEQVTPDIVTKVKKISKEKYGVDLDE